ncbi:MAG: aprataxin-like protein [Caeruleum heppii]|nr:MAG: aprataxin-like protein [Caeruleum heppii]
MYGEGGPQAVDPCSKADLAPTNDVARLEPACSARDGEDATGDGASAEQSVTGVTAEGLRPTEKAKAGLEEPKKRDAFTQLMSPMGSPKKSKSSRKNLSHITSTSHALAPLSVPQLLHTYPGRLGLGAYITSPASFPATRVISHTNDAVLVHDLYPKSAVHILVLPRSSAHALLHPFEAFDDVTFLESVRASADEGRRLVASELRRKFGEKSKTDAAREAALSQDPPPQRLPPGRDWAREVRIGVHAVPSMSHLHIHILSPDRVSSCLRHKKHYNSFSTPFFVPLDEFPLSDEDPRREKSWWKDQGFLRREFRCWRCGDEWKGRGFEEFKAHLEEEMEQWVKE